MSYVSNTTLPLIAAKLTQARSVLVTTHAKPDGDAFGSVIATAHALELAGKSVERWVVPPLPQSLTVLNGMAAPVHLCTEQTGPWPTGEPDAIVIADTGSSSQLGPLWPWVRQRRDRVIVLDHHLRGDDIAAMRYVDTSAAAACEIVAELIDALGVAWDPLIAKALYVGVASDTGWFHFSNTTPRTLRLAARLLEHGVDHAALYQQLEQRERAEKLPLMARALTSLQPLADGTAALMLLAHKDFVETGATTQDTERLVDLPQVVAAVRLVALVTEPEPGRVRISLRSKPGPGAVDVNVLAMQFGGGGHARAAGAKVNGTPQDVLARLRPLIERAMQP